MRIKTVTLNVLFIIAIPLAIWLGYTDRVGWWTIALIFIATSHLTMTWTRRP